MSCFQHHPLSYYGKNKSKIGSGTYSHVQKYCRKDGENIAIKVHNTKTSAFREIALLEECHHSPHIISLLDVGYDSRRQRFYQVMPMAECSLYNQILSNYFMDNPERIKTAIFQILQGIAFLHVKGYIHRDMKSENILAFKDGKTGGYTYQLCDFGLSRKKKFDGETYTSYMVTLYYRPPENILDQEQYTQAIDMWSVGCIFAELILKVPLFSYEESHQVLSKQLKCLGDPKISYPPYLQKRLKEIKKCEFVKNKKWWDKNIKQKVSRLCGNEAYDLLSRFLQLDPSKRISARNALVHPYFSDFTSSPVDIPLLFLNEIYHPKDWRTKTKKFQWSDRNALFIKCCSLGIDKGLTMENIVTCYFFMNKFFYLAPKFLNVNDSYYFMRAIINIVSKIHSSYIIHLRFLEENGDKKRLRRCRNKVLHILKFKLNIYTGEDWFQERQNIQIQKKLIGNHKQWKKILLASKALYRMTIFMPELFFDFPPEKLAEECQRLIMQHYGFEIECNDYIRNRIQKNLKRVQLLFTKNKYFTQEVLDYIFYTKKVKYPNASIESSLLVD